MKGTVSMVVAASGTAIMCAVPALAQAPATAQVWDVRFVVDSTGPFAAGPTATQVGITMFARVGILPNTAASGTNNFGVSRVGGAGAGFAWTVSDPLAALLGMSQGRVERGRTAEVDGRGLLDTSGEPLAGHFAPFRGSLSPQVAPLFLGSNTDPNNGVFANTDLGAPTITRVVGPRALNYGSEGTGPVGVATALDANPANLVGDLAPVYRFYYNPNAHAGAVREVVFTSTGTSARYAYGPDTFGGYASAAAVPLPDQTFTFMVPAPGAGALMVLAGCAWRRRRTG